MCGIVGLYLKTNTYEEKLGQLFNPMLSAMSNRGLDSAGFAVYNNPVANGFCKIMLHHPQENYDWATLVNTIKEELRCNITFTVNSSHALCICDADQLVVANWLKENAKDIALMSSGTKIAIYKEVGTPDEVAKRFKLNEMKGTHIIGHTRMATESAITTHGSHPFSTGEDLCLVHNGSLSNHHRLQEELEPKGYSINTENDTEMAAIYLTDKIINGDSLRTSMEKSLDDLDGFFTFAVGTKDGFSVMRDPFGCKPAVLAETDDYVAMASEYQALSSLPNIENAKLWEPTAGKVYSW